jgi:hypothetical protein
MRKRIPFPKCINCGKKLSDRRSKRCKSCNAKYLCEIGKICLGIKGKANGSFIDGRTNKKYYCEICKKKIHKNTVLYRKNHRCPSCSRKGDLNPNFIHGESCTPYPLEFTEELKQLIRKRDNYECQNCGMTEEKHLIVIGRVLTIHHIDYDKKNCNEENLITLCDSCNVRANYNRNYWIELYTKILIKKGY